MKHKTIGIISLMTVMLFAFATITFGVGDFIIQNSTLDAIFTVSGTTSDVTAVGELSENSTALKSTYWQIANAGTPADGDTGNVSTADQIYDWVIGLGYITDGWNTLDDMILTDSYIYVGNATNDPHGVVVSGDITLSNTGVVSVVNTAGLDAGNITAGTIDNARISLVEDEIPQITSAWANDMDADQLIGLDALDNMIDIAGENITTGTVAAARIDSAMATDAEVAGFEFFTNIANFTGTLTDTKYCTYNSSNSAINCESEGAGLLNIIEDTTPQLGGNLDVNDFGIDGGGNTNMTIDATGNLIIVLA